MKEEDQKREIDERCEKYCASEFIEQRCEAQFAFNAGFIERDLKGTCWQKEDLQGCVQERTKDARAKKSTMTSAAYKSALDEASEACQKEADGSVKACVAAGLEQRRPAEIAACVEEARPKCDKECHGRCQA